MNINKFTQKFNGSSTEPARRLPVDYGNQEIEQEHLLYSLC